MNNGCSTFEDIYAITTSIYITPTIPFKIKKSYSLFYLNDSSFLIINLLCLPDSFVNVILSYFGFDLYVFVLLVFK